MSLFSNPNDPLNRAKYVVWHTHGRYVMRLWLNDGEFGENAVSMLDTRKAHGYIFHTGEIGEEKAKKLYQMLFDLGGWY